MRAPRILIVSADLGGGTGAHVESLIEELDRRGVELRVVCQGPMEMTLPPTVELHPDPSRRWWDRFPLAQARRLLQLVRQIRRWKPDLVHSYFYWPIIYGRILRKAGVIPYLVENREDEGFNLGAGEFRMLRRTRRIPDRVICVSEGVASTFREREGLSSDQIEVIRNGVRLPTTLPSEDRLSHLRQELGIRPGDRVVGLVANLNREVKGVSYFVAAAPHILRDIPDARFLVIGEGELRPGLEEQARSLGVHDRMIFAGFRTDVRDLYPLMEISTLTSLSEGLSITLLESMSFGLPVVATRVGGNPELVVEGETGLMIPPRDPEAFAAAVVRVLSDPSLAQSLGRAARERADAFAISKVADRYLAAYQSSVADRMPA